VGVCQIYTPTIPETDEKGNHYILSEEAILPEIYVMVDCVDNGIVLYSSNIVDSGTCGAEGNNGDNLTWILDDEGVLTISGTGAMANWRKKMSPWYGIYYKVKSVVIEDGVTSIGNYAFFSCASLKNITLPNSVTSIGDHAFDNCRSLNNITLLNGVTSIGDGAFLSCKSLTSITLPNSVKSIGVYAFSECNSLTNAIYLGTAEQWNDIRKNIGSGNDALLNNVKFHEHWPETVWSNNATYHWYQCTYGAGACPVKDEPQAQDGCALHEWENGKCRVCGYICKHTEAEEWTQTAKTHKKKCNNCGVVTVAEEAHEWKDGVCSECEYVCQHKDDNNDHFCDICSKKISDHTGGKATCTQKAVCTTCGQEYGKVKNHDILHHAAKAPTCTEIGWKAYDTCKREGCNYTTYKELPALNHDLEYHEAKPATCTEIGWEAYDTCKREGCNYNTYKELPALKHDLQHHAAKAATCTENGWEAYDTCKREGCTYSTYKEIAALDHDLEHHEAQAATCTEIGWEAYNTCKREGCGYTTYKELPALNHDLEHHEAQAATCMEIGWEAYDTCKREGCNYTTYKELPALGHEDSNNDHFCDACSTKISDHSYESKIAREATTTYTGIRIYTCTKCGHSYTEELAKLPSQTNQADQTNQIEPVNNSNEKDFIGTVTSVFLNVTDLAAKNFRISFWLMIQMLLKAVMQLW